MKLGETADNDKFLSVPKGAHQERCPEAWRLHGNLRSWNFRLTNRDEKWLSSLEAATSAIGMQGEWIRCSFDNNRTDLWYAYDPHGRFKLKTDEHPEMVPRPDEIICLFSAARSRPGKSDKSLEQTVMNSKEGNSYWNHRVVYASGFEFYLFFGDEAPVELLDRMQMAIEKVLEKQ